MAADPAAPAPKVHLRPSPVALMTGAICSVHRRWPSTVITTTTNPEKVTCGNCLRILQAREVTNG